MRAVLLDLDGVLIDSYRVWFHVINATAEALGYDRVSAELFAAAWGQGIEADVADFFPRHTIPQIEREYETRFPEHLEHLAVAEEAAPTLAALRARGVRSAVVTNTPSPLTRDLLARAGLEAEVVVGGTDVPHPKPAPDMLLRACELLDVSPAEALMVGDSRYDREAAQAAGVRFVGLGTSGDIEIHSLSDLLEHLPARDPF